LLTYQDLIPGFQFTYTRIHLGLPRAVHFAPPPASKGDWNLMTDSLEAEMIVSVPHKSPADTELCFSIVSLGDPKQG